ncbi:MAG: lambda-exonuclease family protein, partial [Bacteriovoracaceae bacterium]
MDYKEFLEDRLKGIGGSDAPIILGRCPYQTPFSVWQIKTRKKAISLDRSYPATRGTNLEPAARSMYEINHGDFEDFPSKQFIHKEYNYLFANLDGWNEKKKIILEIKCPLNKERHQDASNGVIPEHYIDQLQHQLFVCTEAEKLHYFSYDDRDHTGYLVEVERDPTWAEENLEKLKTFWEYNV